MRRSLALSLALVAATFFVAALGLGAPGAQATTRHHVAPAHPRRLRAARHRFAPAIPPFDQGEAEAEVHQIAPYRTYPYDPAPYRTPTPYPYTPW